MATTFAPVNLPAGAQQFQDTAIAATADVIKTSAGTLHILEIDNTANVAAVYLKLWDTNGAVVVGTTVPDWVVKVPASTKIDLSLQLGGAPFAVGLAAACVTTGGTAGATPPASNVIFRCLFS